MAQIYSTALLGRDPPVEKHRWTLWTLPVCTEMNPWIEKNKWVCCVFLHILGLTRLLATPLSCNKSFIKSNYKKIHTVYSTRNKHQCLSEWWRGSKESYWTPEVAEASQDLLEASLSGSSTHLVENHQVFREQPEVAVTVKSCPSHCRPVQWCQSSVPSSFHSPSSSQLWSQTQFFWTFGQRHCGVQRGASFHTNTSLGQGAKD